VASTILTVLPTADAHVRDGGSSATNFGRVTPLEVKTDAVYGYTRQAFLTFPLLGAFEPRRATLRLVATLAKGTMGVSAHEVAGVIDEDALTWDTAPPLGEALSGRTITGNGPQIIELDVTAAVLAARDAGRNRVTVALVATSGGEPLLRVNSREAPEGRPVLVLANP
jgi:hypothetical protein